MEPAEALIYLELKYCERCGGLWLRPRDTTTIYCLPCARQMAEVARHPLPQPAHVVSALLALLAALQPWLEMSLECAA